MGELKTLRHRNCLRFLEGDHTGFLRTFAGTAFDLPARSLLSACGKLTTGKALKEVQPYVCLHGSL